ncbi:PP0621 family protein [Saezia sanguinis]|jgi:hypothetical protein|uniref:PP0621 family protein n=1 Tax=Saezia sanguinis TaxID=1965230 RepID=UPI000F8C4474|nr:PP0621 family protein [Saezia sanguinis]
MGILLKLFIFFMAICVGAMIWRVNCMKKIQVRKAKLSQKDHPHRQPQTISGCLYCGVFIPQGAAVAGSGGVYCCKAHQKLHEQTLTNK